MVICFYNNTNVYITVLFFTAFFSYSKLSFVYFLGKAAVQSTALVLTRKALNWTISWGCNGFFLGIFIYFFIAMVMIQYINLEQCTQGWSQDWSQARTFAGASMFICGSWVELSSDARAKRGTVFLSFLSPRLIAASLRRRNDHLIMILVKKGSVLEFFSILLLFLKCCVCSFCVCTCYAALGHFFHESTSKLEQ